MALHAALSTSSPISLESQEGLKQNGVANAMMMALPSGLESQEGLKHEVQSRCVLRIQPYVARISRRVETRHAGAEAEAQHSASPR